MPSQDQADSETQSPTFILVLLLVIVVFLAIIFCIGYLLYKRSRAAK